ASNSGSNPAQSDTDHDGLTDNLEVAAATDPFDPDTDDDLAYDGQDSNPTSPVANLFAPAHRWPFNDLPASIDADTLSADVAGGATFDAVIRGTGATSDGTGVNLPGGNNLDTTPYVDLPNGLISPQRAVTLVGWVTVTSTAGNWARLFDFGNSNNLEVPPAGIGNGTDYFAYTMQRGADGNAQRFTIREEPLGETAFDPNTVTTVGQEIFYAATVDSSAGNCGVFNLYRDGEWILQSAGSRYPLSVVTDVNNWLGRSQYGGDTHLSGVYNEFRIYNGVLNAEAVKTIYNSGADNTFHITDSVEAGAELQLTWNSRPNLTYTIESSPDLNTWSVANANIPSTGLTTTGSVAKGTGRLFFRVRLD
ncbi:MAG: hypothetical protein JWL81_876, partial [Verrucomicrobiales bacterium]|nr:hypothetical protein [Verrucomicrobiales bacterium]